MVLDFLANSTPNTIWTVADIEKATKLDRYDISSALIAAHAEGFVDRYPPTDARPAAYAMGEDQRRRWPS